jgi:hypothetical protein
MKENNKSNGANRFANKNTIIIAAIVAVAITIILGVVISTKLTTLIGPPVSAANKTIIMHIHPVLKLTVDGKPVILPKKYRHKSLIVERSFSRSVRYAGDDQYVHACYGGNGY